MGAATLILIASIPSAAAEQRSVKFATGETLVVSDRDADRVVVKDLKGTVRSESLCDPGTFDAYLAVFTKLKAAVARRDRKSVVKLVKFPFRVNVGKPLIVRDVTSLSRDYDSIFTPRVSEKIRRAEPAAVFCRNGMGMFGDGVAWAIVSQGKARISVLNP